MGKRWYWIVVEIEAPGLQHVQESRFRQRSILNRLGERRHDRMVEPRACIEAINHIEPPLQAHLARGGPADELADAGDLKIECVERPQLRPLRIGGKKTCEVAILVMPADDRV